MRKYSNVDILAALGAVVEINTEHYKSDFKYDVDMFKAAARQQEGGNNHFLWLSRQNGTECFKERDVYIKDIYAHNSWVYYADSRSENIRAYSVEVTGIENGRVMGNLIELDYHRHTAEVKKSALPAHTVNVKYKHSDDLQFSFAEHKNNHGELVRCYGQTISIRVDPEDNGALQDILKQAREFREKNSRAAVFKVRVQNPKKPSITQRIKAGNNADRAAPSKVPQRKKDEHDL